jgi:hypothetical protein
MKKGCIKSVIVSFILILSVVLYFSQAMHYSAPPTYITEHSLGINSPIKFMYVNSSLSASAIQILQVDKATKKERVLHNYEDYDVLVGYTLKGGILTVFLRKGYCLRKSPSDFVKCAIFSFEHQRC